MLVAAAIMTAAVSVMAVAVVSMRVVLMVAVAVAMRMTAAALAVVVPVLLLLLMPGGFLQNVLLVRIWCHDSCQCTVDNNKADDAEQDSAASDGEMHERVEVGNGLQVQAGECGAGSAASTGSAGFGNEYVLGCGVWRWPIG